MSIESQPTTDTNITPAETPVKQVNWKQVGAFLGLTFGLTWLLDLALFLNGGLKSPAALIIPPIPDAAASFFRHSAGHVLLQRQPHQCQE